MALVLVVGLLCGVVSFFLLLAAAHLAGQPASPFRILLSSTLSAVYGGLCLLPGCAFLTGCHIRALFLLGSGVVAFGLKKSALKALFLYAAMELVIGGTMSAVSMALSAVSVTALWIYMLGQRGKTVFVELTLAGKQVRFKALKDTGNTLKDPLTGRSVLVVSPSVGEILTGFGSAQFKDPVKAIQSNPIKGLRLIPYRTIDRPEGLLLGLEVKEGRVGSRRGSVVVAFAGEELDEQGNFQGLTGGML